MMMDDVEDGRNTQKDTQYQKKNPRRNKKKEKDQICEILKKKQKPNDLCGRQGLGAELTSMQKGPRSQRLFRRGLEHGIRGLRGQ